MEIAIAREVDDSVVYHSLQPVGQDGLHPGRCRLEFGITCPVTRHTRQVPFSCTAFVRDLRELKAPKVNDVKTMMIYTHVLNRGCHGVESPLDRLRKEPAREGRGIILSGQPKTPEANGRMVQKSLDRKELPAPRGDSGFVLG